MVLIVRDSTWQLKEIETTRSFKSLTRTLLVVMTALIILCTVHSYLGFLIILSECELQNWGKLLIVFQIIEESREE